MCCFTVTNAPDSQINNTNHTGLTNDDGTHSEGQCETYYWTTVIAILNTLILLMVLLYITYNIYLMKKKEISDTRKRDIKVKFERRKSIDLSASQHTSPSHLRYTIQAADTNQLKPNTEKKQCSPKPTLPSNCPPPCPTLGRLNCPDSQTESKNGLLLPPPPSICLSPTCHETQVPKDILDSDEEDHDYEYIEFPINPILTQHYHQANSKQEETNEKEEENKRSSTAESKGKEHKYDNENLGMPASQEAKQEQTQINATGRWITKL